MPLLLAYRRWWCLVFLGLLLLPTIGLVTPDLPAPLRAARAVPPLWWERATERLDPYINNNYGLRGVFMAAHAAYGRAMKSTRERPVLVGQDGQLFYTGEGALDQSLGRLFRTGQMDMLVRVTERMRQELDKAGIRFGVVSPPNAQSVIGDLMPEWAQAEQRHPTEYDFAAKSLTANGISFVDLRPILKEARAGGPVYQKTDTHWNSRGAVLGFNAAMRAVGRDDLQIDPAAALGAPVAKETGDLARYLGESSDTGDTDLALKGPMIVPADLKPITGLFPPPVPGDPFDSYAFETGHPGPRILIIGDSFSQRFWPGLLAARSSAFAWTHHRNCRFDWGIIGRFKPDLVVYAPVERGLPCVGTPAGLSVPPADKAKAS